MVLWLQAAIALVVLAIVAGLMFMLLKKRNRS